MLKFHFIAGVALILLAAACGPRPEVPVDRQLLHIGTWVPVTRDSNERRRAAPATIIAFRSSKEFVEVHCWVIEQPDQTLYISSAQRPIAAVGRWEKHGAEIHVTREVAMGSLCATKELTFRISAQTVAGNAGETYSPITRLVAPDFESYVTEARRSGTRCTPEKK